MTCDETYARSRRAAALLGAALAGWLAVAAAGAHESAVRNLDALSRAVSRAPEDAMLYLRRGELHRLRGERQLARADFERALALAPRLSALDLHRGRLLLEEGHADRALDLLARYTAREPRSAEGWTWHARALAALGRTTEAVSLYSRALALRSSPELYLERSEAMLDDDPTALERAARALDDGVGELGPVPALIERAIALAARAGDVDGALRRIDDARAASPFAAPWWLRRGELLEAAGRTGEARRAVLAARDDLERRPSHRRRTPLLGDLAARIHSALERLPADDPRPGARP